MFNKKSQILIEYLVNYSWVFLSILIVSSLLYYYGFMDFSQFLTPSSEISGKFKIPEFILNDHNGVVNDNTTLGFFIQNDYSQNITIYNYSITYNNIKHDCTINSNINPFQVSLAPSFRHIFYCEFGSDIVENKFVELDLEFQFKQSNIASAPIHLGHGKIMARAISSPLYCEQIYDGTPLHNQDYITNCNEVT